MMTEIEDETSPSEPVLPAAYVKNDPITTGFIIGALVLLAVLAILIVIAAGRPPAGL